MTVQPQALLVEDVEECRVIARRLLQSEGFDVLVAADGEEAVALARAARPELMLVDLGLPLLDGAEVCRRIREFSDAYVIMLSARGSEVDRVLGLGAGADDYVTKPYSVLELSLRIRAMRRRPRMRQDHLRVFGPLEIDPISRETRVEGAAVNLTRTEFDLLETLSASPRRPFTRQTLMLAVWGSSAFGDAHLVDVHIGNLRRKLKVSGADTRHLHTLRGVGYRFDP